MRKDEKAEIEMQRINWDDWKPELTGYLSIFVPQWHSINKSGELEEFLAQFSYVFFQFIWKHGKNEHLGKACKCFALQVCNFFA